MNCGLRIADCGIKGKRHQHSLILPIRNPQSAIRNLMTCQKCRDEASVHLTESVNGQVREVHLCGSCARKAGLPLEGPSPDLGLEAVVQGLILAHVGELVGE